MAYKYPDTTGSKTQKLLYNLYKEINLWCCSLYSTLIDIGVKDQPLGEHLDDSGSPIYDDNNYDYILNSALNKVIAESDQYQKIFKEVDEIRSKEIRESDLEVE